jgi:hypothetical protein
VEKLIPYSLYLPQEHINKLKGMAKQRKASAFIRDALIMALENGKEFNSGYNKGLRDACKVVSENEHLKFLSYKGKPMNSMLVDQLKMLAKNG